MVLYLPENSPTNTMSSKGLIRIFMNSLTNLLHRFMDIFECIGSILFIFFNVIYLLTKHMDLNCHHRCVEDCIFFTFFNTQYNKQTLIVLIQCWCFHKKNFFQKWWWAFLYISQLPASGRCCTSVRKPLHQTRWHSFLRLHTKYFYLLIKLLVISTFILISTWVNSFSKKTVMDEGICSFCLTVFGLS